MKNPDTPEEGKQYRLTGSTSTPCVAKGNTWAESEVKPESFAKVAANNKALTNKDIGPEGFTTSGITVAGLRELLHGLTDQAQAVHIVTKEEYGQVISTKGVTGIRLHTDENGKNHITLTI